jgi:hypothetical protein
MKHLRSLFGICFGLIMLACSAAPVAAQNKSRRLNKGEKSALKQFKKNKESKSGKKKFFLFGKRKERSGYERSYHNQDKEVRKRMRRHRRQMWRL